jgi:hypothetical protein
MTSGHLREHAAFVPLVVILGLTLIFADPAPSAGQSWNAASQQESPDGHINPTRTTQSHTEADGRIVDKTTVETLGPDGRYVPYQETEKESERVNDTVTRNVERTFGLDTNGGRTLIEETREESRRMSDGEEKVTRTDSRPDADGRLQVVRRELEDSKQEGVGVRVTNTIVLMPDVNGGLSPSVQTEQRETKGSGDTVRLTKSTLLPDGNGGWTLAEVREGMTKRDGSSTSTEQSVMRPDPNGHLLLVERTVEKQTHTSGEKRDTSETYSTNVPGQAGDDSLQLVQRATTVRQTNSNGALSTNRKVEQPSPGDPNGRLQVTQETIDIVRPGNGVANETRTVLAPNADGYLGQVLVDIGKTSNPAAVRVDTKPPKEPQ